MSLVACTFIGDPPQLDPDKAARIRVLISDFRNRKEKRGESFVTETMMAHGYPWALRIYPRGANSSGSDADTDDDADAEWVSCYLIYASDAHDRKEFPVDAKATIRSSGSKAVNISMGTVDGEHHGYGIRNWLQRNDACKEEVLTIEVDICVDKKKKSIWYPTKALKDSTDSKLRKLYSSSESSDVTFIVGSTRKEFKGHKCILELSSPYLYGLVLSKAEEIDDIDTAAATCEIAEQEGISSDGFVPISSVKDDEDDEKDEDDNEDAPARSTKNTPSSFPSSGSYPPITFGPNPFGAAYGAASAATSSIACNGNKSTTAKSSLFGGFGQSGKQKASQSVSSSSNTNNKMIFGSGGGEARGGGGGSTSVAKAPSPFSTFSASPSSSNVSIELPDVNKVDFGALFKFLYTGTEPKYIRRNENYAKDMLLLADRFDCIHLKLYAESVLAEKFLDTSNAAHMILFADAHSCALLKEAAMDMCATNPKTVIKSEGYSRLKESDVMSELWEHSSGECGEYIRVADRTPEEDVDNLDVTSLRERLRSASIHNVDGSKEMLVKRWKETIA